MMSSSIRIAKNDSSASYDLTKLILSKQNRPSYLEPGHRPGDKSELWGRFTADPTGF